MSRTLPRLVTVVFAAALTLVAAPARAQEQQLASNAILAPASLLPDAVSRAALFPVAPAAESSFSATQPPFTAAPQALEFSGARRPALLPALYASTIVLEALDAHSTITGLKLGATEANPFMKGTASNPAALLAVKAGAAAGSIYMAEKLWRRNRVAAVVMMAVMNSVTAAVVAHNYKVVSRLR